MIKLIDILNENIVDIVNEYINKSNYNILDGWGSCAFYTDDFIKTIPGAKVAYMPLANPKTEDPEDHIVPVINNTIIDFAKVPGSGVSKNDRKGTPPKLNPGYEENNWPRLVKLEDNAFKLNGVYGKLGYIKGAKYADWEYEESFGKDLKAGKYPIIMNNLPEYANSSKKYPPKKLNENYPPYKADMILKTRYKASDVWTNDPKLAVKKGYLEGNTKKPDPKKGTGKKPEGSDRRLYTDENPKDTVRIKFKTAQDIKDTLAKKSFKAKPHARKSQVINLIHQRVRAAYGKAKDPDVKSRLKRALDYIEKRKEASKKKTQAMKNK